MTALTSRVEAILTRQRLIAPGSRVGVAVSGGLDSVVLLHVLNRLKDAHRWQVSVLHFNHQLRGRASSRDERFVRALANSLGLPCKVGRGEVRRWAERHKVSVEMGARELRHRFFARASRNLSMSQVALAHHADDQVELFFLRLLRGTGPEGLGGMRAIAPSPFDASIKLVRPLLELSRAELAQFAKDERLKFREDASNLELQFERNRVRQVLLPLLRTEFQPGLDRVVTRLMDILREESDFVAEAARRAGDENKAVFVDLPVALQRRLLMAELRAAGIQSEFDHVERLRREAGTPGAIEPGRVAWRDPEGRLHLDSNPEARPAFDLSERRIGLGKACGRVSFDGIAIRWRRGKRKQGWTPAGDPGRETFDFDKVGVRVRLRHWRPGDRFQPIGMAQSVKLQDLFTNGKIPGQIRRQLVVAETAGGIIFWVEGLRIAEVAKVDAGTKRVLNWEWKRPKNLGLTSTGK